ncbi:hypothetical protein [Spirillospora albida]|uniref:hypothetical protein n=1 Tax=Spirillospora albida TaxID=58123 RepID=UPI0004C22125|nr:hypothetical protein [Spirillospora albida]
MNLTDRRRKVLFGGIVVALTGVGIYLTVASPQAGPDGAKERPKVAASARPVGPASPPPGIQSTVNPDAFDIYRLLPFSQREIATAADEAQRFIAAYGTYRYDEDPKVFTGRLSGFVTDELLAELERGASTPGILDERRRDQVVAQGSATLDRVRDIEDNSIIFLVTGKQRVSKGGVDSTDSRQYAVTVARDGNSLRVYAFQPADQGQEGDTG